MYTAPPGPDEEAAESETATSEDTTPTAAEANWTGELPADD